MKPQDVLPEHLSQKWCVKSLCCIRDKVGLFGESIHKDQDVVIALGWRELDNGIHAEGLPRL